MPYRILGFSVAHGALVELKRGVMFRRAPEGLLNREQT